MKAVIIVVDGLRTDFLSCYDGMFDTPNIDRIAGVRLNNFIVHAPETFPSIATLFTGLYPHHHKVGYRHLGDTFPYPSLIDLMPKDRFSMFLFAPFGGSVKTPPKGTYYEDVWGFRGDNKTLHQYPDVSKAVEFMQGKDDYFVYLYFWTVKCVYEEADGPPHVLTQNPERVHEYIEHSRTLMGRMDHEIGRVLDAMGDVGKNDFILFTADHGESIKGIDWRLLPNNVADTHGGAELSHNGSRFDTAVRVPFLLRGLDLIDAVYKNQFAQVDACATLATLITGEPYKIQTDGQDKSLWLRHGTDFPEDSKVFICKTSSCGAQAVRTNRWKLWFDKTDMQLFDHVADPFERENVIAQHPQVAVQLLKSMPREVDDSLFTTDEVITRRTQYSDPRTIRALFEGRSDDDKWKGRVDTYDKSSRVRHAETLDRIVREFAECSNVLDVGCGTGVVMEALSAHGISVVGVDKSPAMVEKALRYGKATVVDIENNEFLDGSFDGAVCRLVIHHVPEPLRALEEIRQLLQPSGKLIVIERVPPEDDLLELYRWVLEPSETRHVLSAAGWADLVGRAGFEVTKCEDIWLHDQSLIEIIDVGFMERRAAYHTRVRNLQAIRRDDRWGKYVRLNEESGDIRTDLRQVFIVARKGA